MADSFDVVVFRGRTSDFSLGPFVDAQGNAVNLASADVLRVKISRMGVTVLDIDSVTPTSHNSLTSFTANQNTGSVRIDQGDTAALSLDTYTMEVGAVIQADSARYKPISYGVLSVLPGGDGNSGLTP